MARVKISQREARRLRKRVLELKKQYDKLLGNYTSDFSGTHIRTIRLSEIEAAVAANATRLGYALVLRHSNSTQDYWVYAMKPNAAV